MDVETIAGSPKANVENDSREETSPITSASRDMRLGFRRESVPWQGKNADFGQVVRGQEEEFARGAALRLDSTVNAIFSESDINFLNPKIITFAAAVRSSVQQWYTVPRRREARAFRECGRNGPVPS